MKAPRKQGGFTLVELMVAMVLVTLLIGVMFQVAIVVLKSYRQHREAVGIQRAARGSLDLISDAVRNASAGVPTAQLTDATGCTPITAIEVVNGDDEPDQLTVINASGGVVTSLRQDYAQSTGDMTVLDGEGLRAGDLVIVTDFGKGHVLKLDGAPIDNGATWTLPITTLCTTDTFNYTKGALVMRAKVAHYYVEDLDGVPTLWMDPDGDGDDDPEPLAEGVEDFQIAVGVDVNGNGTVTDTDNALDEWFYNDEADADPPLITVTPWRALRLTVVARAPVTDVEGDWSARPGIEDRDEGNLDGFRRRTASTVVEIRNLTGSP